MDIHVFIADYENPEHAEAIITILDAYSRDPMGQGKPLDKYVRENLIPELDAFPTAVSILAYADGQPAGLANCFMSLSSFKAAPLLNVHDLAVMPGYRGNGIGRQLLEVVEEKAKQMGCCKITLEVRDDNRAQSLYRRAGFGPDTPEMY
ncbi:MAG: GNAT family N-acetyltransferase, partial [Cyclonatronaceae bacterium]